MGTADGVTQRQQTGEVGFLLPDEDIVNVAQRDADKIRQVAAQHFLDRLRFRQEVKEPRFVAGPPQGGVQVGETEREHRIRRGAPIGVDEENPADHGQPQRVTGARSTVAGRARPFR